jgi:hypothetical protein
VLVSVSIRESQMYSGEILGIINVGRLCRDDFRGLQTSKNQSNKFRSGPTEACTTIELLVMSLKLNPKMD